MGGVLIPVNWIAVPKFRDSEALEEEAVSDEVFTARVREDVFDRREVFERVAGCPYIYVYRKQSSSQKQAEPGRGFRLSNASVMVLHWAAKRKQNQGLLIDLQRVKGAVGTSQATNQISLLHNTKTRNGGTADQSSCVRGPSRQVGSTIEWMSSSIATDSAILEGSTLVIVLIAYSSS